jgi:hypothetical protein
MQLTCNKCGTVAFAVSRGFAESEVMSFNKYFFSQSKEVQALFGSKPSSLAQYEACGCGNPHTNFRKAKDGDCPDGCTLSPIISDELGALG